jgi:hypothetical protein
MLVLPAADAAAYKTVGFNRHKKTGQPGYF